MAANEGAPGGVNRFTCLVDEGIVTEPLEGGLQFDKLDVRYAVQCTTPK
jgi:hypothetical protein